MKFYIASSHDNLAQLLPLRDALLERGHIVYDWTNLLPRIPKGATKAQRKRLLDEDKTGKTFSFCSEAAGSVDVVIYLGQSGQDTGVEIGIAFGSGVPVVGILAKGEQAGLMLKGCFNCIYASAEDFLQHFFNHKRFYEV